jgi:hypothetical protein
MLVELQKHSQWTAQDFWRNLSEKTSGRQCLLVLWGSETWNLFCNALSQLPVSLPKFILCRHSFDGFLAQPKDTYCTNWNNLCIPTSRSMSKTTRCKRIVFFTARKLAPKLRSWHIKFWANASNKAQRLNLEKSFKIVQKQTEPATRRTVVQSCTNNFEFRCAYRRKFRSQTSDNMDGWNNKQQTTNNKQQTINKKQQTTNNKQQTTNNKQQQLQLQLQQLLLLRRLLLRRRRLLLLPLPHPRRLHPIYYYY